ncbi:MAG: hypothetical protein R3271_11365 [Methylophaga sp.]|uniref:hypothetical protein n=1 Tax=Methylophaga sp. TaxID=2024840 RepID=UPI00299F10A8|nr:hypothetical protein [Methylophaga sp.]MDX1750908.1 hypothetical protein [Methylophaga sp.]
MKEISVGARVPTKKVKTEVAESQPEVGEGDVVKAVPAKTAKVNRILPKKKQVAETASFRFTLHDNERFDEFKARLESSDMLGIEITRADAMRIMLKVANKVPKALLKKVADDSM